MHLVIDAHANGIDWGRFIVMLTGNNVTYFEAVNITRVRYKNLSVCHATIA